MHDDCIKKVMAAANGRNISDAKIKAIDEAISSKMRDLARQDPQGWGSKSVEQRVTEAAQSAMKDIEAEAGRTEYLGTLQLLKTAETNQRLALAGSASAMKLTKSQALIRDIENTHNYNHALHDEAVSGLKDMLDAAQDKDGTGVLRNLGMRLFDLDNPAMTADVVREVFKGADGHTGNAVAKAGAQSWLDTIEKLRLRFNAAGGDVGKLGYGYLAQQHDAVKILAAKPEEWAQKVLPLLDRKQYLKEDGALMTPAELLPILAKVHATLASNGLNKVEPGQYKGIGKRANAGSDRRVLHFKDGDAWMAYMQEFGEGSLYDAMVGHVGHMTRNIGLVERYGPNPELQFKLQADIAQRADGAGSLANRSLGNTPEAYWAIASGKTGAPENVTVGKWAQNLRNVQTAAKLGGAVISSFTDVGTIAHTLHYDRLPYFDMLKNIGKNFSQDHREFLQAHGIIAENLTSTLNRWTGDNMTHSLTGRVANSVMKLSFMNAWTDGLRSAFSATMMQGFAKKLGNDWSKLDEWDRHLMSRKGITEEDWNIISKAQPTERDGVKYLTRDSILGVDNAHADSLPNRPPTSDQFGAIKTAEVAGARAKADEARASYEKAKVDAASIPDKEQRKTFLAEARGRLGSAEARSKSLEKDLQPSLDRYSQQLPESMRAFAESAKQQAATKWMAFVSDESQFAVVNPDMATRAIVTGGGMPAGTVRGEAMRTFMQFKSFPLAMMTRHWTRLFDTPQGLEGAPAGFGAQTQSGATINRMAVMAGLNVSLMMLGAVVLQTKSLLNGKDPYDMGEEKFWARAMTQGGGMGYLGDLIFKDPTEQRGSSAEQGVGTILGPSAGAAAGLVGDLMLTNAWELAKGKDTHAVAEAMRWTNSQLPYASLWQVRGAWEHWFVHNAQEAVNPDYLGRMSARAMKDWKQDYYWTPGEIAPHRAPNLSKAAGG